MSTPTPNPLPPAVKPPIVNQFNKSLQHIVNKDLAESQVGPGLDVKSLRDVLQVSKAIRANFSKAMENKKEEELLHQVLNANPKKVMDMLALLLSAKTDKDCIVLKRLSSQEDYESISQDKAEKENHDKSEKESQDKSKNELVQNKSEQDKHKNEQDKKASKIVRKRKWKAISPLEAAAWCGDNFLVQILLEYVPLKQKKEALEQLEGILNRKATEENGGYLAPYNALMQAYEKYINSHEVMEGTATMSKEAAAEMQKELDRLWLQIGACHRLLPAYGLQEFCDKKPHDPVPDYAKEPSRGYLVNENASLDLDALGVKYSLFKKEGDHEACTCSNGIGIRWSAGSDHAAIRHLLEVRTSELKNIIKSLSAVASESQAKASSPAPK